MFPETCAEWVRQQRRGRPIGEYETYAGTVPELLTKAISCWWAERSSTGKIIILTSPMRGIMMTLMRTTLTIDPDVERLLQREIRRTDKSLKTVVNDALRLGLGMQGKPPRGSRYKVNPHPFAFKPGVDVDRLNQLVDELEADELARQRNR